VEVSPLRKSYGIRQPVEADIKVKLPNGKPAPAGTEVAFAAVDEALLELQPNRSWELMQAMYQRHSYGWKLPLRSSRWWASVTLAARPAAGWRWRQGTHPRTAGHPA
jgi:hypothetical protein